MHRHSHFVLGAVTASVLAISCPSAIHAAGPNAEAEAEIRQIVARMDEGGPRPEISNSIFWSGAYLRPTIHPERGQPIREKGGVGDRVPGSQKAKTEIIRIVFAESGDLAYEYSKGNLQFDLKSGEHASFETGTLRVWQKDGGEWKIAAWFTRPYDSVPVPANEANK